MNFLITALLSYAGATIVNNLYLSPIKAYALGCLIGILAVLFNINND